MVITRSMSFSGRTYPQDDDEYFWHNSANFWRRMYHWTHGNNVALIRKYKRMRAEHRTLWFEHHRVLAYLQGTPVVPYRLPPLDDEEEHLFAAEEEEGAQGEGTNAAPEDHQGAVGAPEEGEGGHQGGSEGAERLQVVGQEEKGDGEDGVVPHFHDCAPNKPCDCDEPPSHFHPSAPTTPCDCGCVIYW